MKNEYYVEVFTFDGGVPFDTGYFTNLRKARYWACGRGSKWITVKIWKNGKPFLVYGTK